VSEFTDVIGWDWGLAIGDWGQGRKMTLDKIK